jgi:hypothetical protein
MVIQAKKRTDASSLAWLLSSWENLACLGQI